jgi:signal transduction histidine kinase
MSTHDQDGKQPRAATLENGERTSPTLQEAERDLIATKHALEKRTLELTLALAAKQQLEAELRQQREWYQIELESRENAEAALRDADRRKDEFLATLAHELRNPLAPIRQAALISKAPGATEAQKRWSHDVIDRQVQHMSLLLDDLLDISRVTRGTLALRMQPTELASVIDAAVETARPTIDGKRHLLSVEIPREPVRFTADPLRVAQVLSNLLTNAAKYTDPEGQIRLTATCEADDVIIRVADTGIGISAAALPRVFNMFSQVHSTTDRSEGGLGIGLALAQGLIELHGGKIEAGSAGLGCGSEFTVRLPRTALVEAPQGLSSSADFAPAILSRRILIADDNRDSAETLAALLRLDGHEVTTVHDGPVALSAFGEFKPEVALLDIGMPGLTGYEVARKMRQSASGAALTLIAITGWGQDVDKQRAHAAGFDHHLTKPVDPHRLADLLRF